MKEKKLTLPVTLPAVDDPDGWRGLMKSITAMRATCNANLAALAKERESLALAALTGDKAALGRQAAIDQELAALAAELANLTAAREQAEAGHERAAGILTNRRDQARAVVLTALAGKREAATLAVDKALAGLATALRDWLESYDSLKNEGVPTRRDRAPFALKCALQAAIRAVDSQSGDRQKSLITELLGDSGAFYRVSNQYVKPLMASDFEVDSCRSLARVLAGDPQPFLVSETACVAEMAA
ncbi:MAG: hypothetical protein KDJ31_04820 [Candidatus Competibacteraceae bacterium]|nr:hypothetical protein [Candidatus Competibacteraceae bacterium]MCB1820700.1 hypothetical protein [Candidatus Competibacteraceae bacterium]